ncbi:MAG: 4Fe-4S dicluster domain-containing protein [bacterium]|nr:4Fe-4S dicluster domain-containing protein [bacterium]
MVNQKELYLVSRKNFAALFDSLCFYGYTVIGPTHTPSGIAYEPIESVEDLPIGWSDEQFAGSYRLIKLDTPQVFHYVVSQHSWKTFLNPAVRQLWKAEKKGKSFETRNRVSEEARHQKYAFLGVRTCELHAILIQDKVYTTAPFIDPYYAELRKTTFIVAVNCSVARNTCFCSSMHTGPKVSAELPFDLAITELFDTTRHDFLIEIGSDRGRDIMGRVPKQPATTADIQSAESVVATTISQISKTMNITNVKQLLEQNLDHPHWQDIARRCLTCGNCTMVCPTCFCSTVEDYTDLLGTTAERIRKQDVCFNLDFSYIHGGSIRTSPASRYRQWLTHKLARWFDQFGCSGCVGCGRCITWCPVGIDITEEVRFFQDAGKNNP